MLRFKAIALVLCVLLSKGAEISAVWPFPRRFNTGSMGMRLGSNFSIQLCGPLEYDTPQDLRDAIGRTLIELRNNRMGRLLVGGASADSIKLSDVKSLNILQLDITNITAGQSQIASIAQNSILPFGKRNESIILSVPPDGSAATLEAASSLGLFRGLTTFLQLWYWNGTISYTVQAPIHIEDTPAYVSWG